MGRIYFEIDVPIGPEWRHIELLRLSVLNCLTTIFHNHDFCESVSIVTSELLENAVRYGDWRNPDRSDFKLRVFGNEASVQIEVSNPVSPGSEHARELLRTVEWLGTFSSPEEAYEARLRDIASQSTGLQMSRLGLARVAYQSNCKLAAFLEEGRVARILATIPI